MKRQFKMMVLTILFAFFVGGCGSGGDSGGSSSGSVGGDANPKSVWGKSKWGEKKW